jgi:hypothetical protein
MTDHLASVRMRPHADWLPLCGSVLALRTSSATPVANTRRARLLDSCVVHIVTEEDAEESHAACT